MILSHHLCAQELIIYPIYNTVHSAQNLNFDFPKSMEASEDLTITCGQMLTQLQNKGYLTASIDSFRVKKDTANVYIYLGEKYEAIQLSWENMNSEKLTFLKNMKFKKETSFQNFNILTKKLLEESENNGYPFAHIELQNIEFEKNQISADAQYSKGRYFEIDSLVNYLSAKVKPEFLENLLGVKKGDMFDQSKISKIDSKLKQLNFLQSNRKPTVEFFDSGAKVYLFLKERKVNKFDILLGILPNSNITNRLKIIGQVNLELVNALKYGEKFKLVYNGYSEQNKDFEVATDFLYLPKMRIGADAFFKIYLNDTTFLEREAGVGLSYPLFENSLFKVTFNQKVSQLLSINTDQIINSKQLPRQIDYVYNAFGFKYNLQNLDNFLTPRRGQRLTLNAAFGFRNVSKNNNILSLKDVNNPAFNFESLYDSIQLNTNNLNLVFQFENYFQVGESATILGKLNTSVLTGVNLFNNQKYRIGGFNNLRGFDEQSILTDKYTIATLEYRYILQGNSYFSAFSDAALLLEREDNLAEKFEMYNAFGIGLNFETNSGIFGLQYAFGKMPDSNFDMRNGKVHFGYINLF